MSDRAPLGARLYTGETSFDFVGRFRLWVLVSSAILLLSVAALVLRGGLNLGIEFSGGAEFQAGAPGVSESSIPGVRDAVTGTGVPGLGEPIVTVVGDEKVRVRTGEVTQDEANEIRDAIAAELDVDPDAVTTQVVGPSWGGEITRKALYGLGAFLVFIAIYLSITFEWRMAVSALVALFHDIVATIGIYAIVGFDVTPATVIGLLTILGYSLYDTVVVFDKVRENTRGILAQSKLTYAEAANLAVNQTIVRSVITTIFALLPVGAILFVGAWVLGAGTLKDFALVLFTGMAVGTYSSIFVATPLLVWLRNKEPQIQALDRRVKARRAGRGPVPATVGAPPAEVDPDDAETVPGTEPPAPRRTVRPMGERSQPMRSTRSQRKSGPPSSRR